MTVCTHAEVRVMRSRQLFLTAVSTIVVAAAGMFAAYEDAHAQRQKRLVESVDIEGNYRLRDEDIFQSLKTRPGDAYDQKTVQSDLEALLALDVLDKVQTRVSVVDGQRGGIIVIFTLLELPLINDLKFIGLQDVTEEDVLEALRENQTGIAKNGIYDPVKANAARGVIKRLLASRGRPDVVVEVRVNDESFKTVSLTFVISRVKRF